MRAAAAAAGQLSLFHMEPPRVRLQMPRPPRVARARTADPQSSHQAHERRERGLSRQSEAVLQLIRKHCAERGLTACELAKRMTHASGEYVRTRYAISRRAADLLRVGFVSRGEARACTVSGSRQCTWFPVSTPRG